MSSCEGHGSPQPVLRTRQSQRVRSWSMILAYSSLAYGLSQPLLPGAYPLYHSHLFIPIQNLLQVCTKLVPAPVCHRFQRPQVIRRLRRIPFHDLFLERGPHSNATGALLLFPRRGPRMWLVLGGCCASYTSTPSGIPVPPATHLHPRGPASPQSHFLALAQSKQ
jgi:hypothetical protein